MRPKQFRIPTLLGIGLLFLLATGGFYVADNFTSLVGRAGTAIVPGPQNLTVSNITDTSFAVSWETEQPIAAFVRYGAEEKDMTAYDVRDSDNIPKQRTHHYVEISGLEPNSQIQYDIVIATAAFAQEPVIIGPTIQSQPQILPVYGTILTPDGAPTAGTVVYATIQGSVLSRFIEQGDGWVIPLSALRTQDGQSYLCNTSACADDQPIIFEASGTEGSAYVQTTIQEARPLSDPLALTFDNTRKRPQEQPEDTIRESEVDISESQETTPSANTELSQDPTPTLEPTNTPTPTLTPTPVVLGTSTQEWDVSVLTPEQGSISRYPQPLIRGEGVPGAEVEITIESDVEQIGTVRVRTDGTWMWTPGLPLDPGRYVITVKTIDGTGAPKILTRTFTIAKSGEQVLSSSTPSATLTPQTTPSTAPTPSVIATPTSQYPNTPTPTPPDLPQTSSTLPTIVAIIGGGILFILALALL